MNFKLFLRDNKEAVDINVTMSTDANALADFIEKNNIGTIVISTEFGDKTIANVNFLSNIINKQNISEIHIMCEVLDYSLVYKFENLRKITLCYHKKNTVDLDLSMLPKLERLSLNGNIIINGLESSKLQELLINSSDVFRINSRCETLKSIEIIGADSFNLEQTMFLSNLNKLVLTQSKLTSLNGVEHLKKLESLAINHCKNLRDISSISECTKLKKIEFDTCKKIENFDKLSILKEVKGLVITKCGDVPSLSFIQKMTGLKFLSFGANIVDGDLTPCLRLENVGIIDKKHYNLKAKELPKNKEYAFWKL